MTLWQYYSNTSKYFALQVGFFLDAEEQLGADTNRDRPVIQGAIPINCFTGRQSHQTSSSIRPGTEKFYITIFPIQVASHTLRFSPTRQKIAKPCTNPKLPCYTCVGIVSSERGGTRLSTRQMTPGRVHRLFRRHRQRCSL